MKTTKFSDASTNFLDLLKSTFDSPNRARIAMQKLHTYTQSPRQDIRSFCSKMRKLFQETDRAMSSTMKLELLLSKVNPSYRLDLLKQQPKDAEEFEILAKDIENTYLV
jgi:spore coat polysaccharide biosynthesis predicted glycosyltransferase SpsG